MYYLEKLSTAEQTKPEILQQLLNIWEKSVRATHHFLQETDILELKILVADYLENVPLWVMHQDSKINSNITSSRENNKSDPNEPAAPIKPAKNLVAFMSVAQRKIEMLFVSPDHFRKKLGQQLIQYAFEHLHAEFVDVNEQNPKALAFYEHYGFKVYKRSTHDDQGRPFPILKLHKRFS